MKLFDVLNDFIAGKKIRNNDMSKNEEWLEYNNTGNYMQMKSTRFRYIPDIYHIQFTDLIRDDWHIID